MLVTLPDGTTTADDAVLSSWLDHPVALTRAGAGVHGTYEIALDFENESTAEWFQWDGPNGSFHDSARTQVSIIGADTLGPWESAASAPTSSSRAARRTAGSTRLCTSAPRRSRW